MKKIIIFAAILCMPASLLGQNLNPEVKVTNDYAAKLEGIEKMSLPMLVPDSLLRFDYHFDYNVFDSPYKGAYEFSPYSVTIKPEPAAYDGKRLYLRGGAGYTLNPEFLAVWSPVQKSNMDLSTFVDYSGYGGNYRQLDSKNEATGAKFGGYDHKVTAGVDWRLFSKSLETDLQAGYDGIFSETAWTDLRNVQTHAPYFKARILSSASMAQNCYLEMTAQYRFAYDAYSIAKASGSNTSYNHVARLDGTVAPVFAKLPFRPSIDFTGFYGGYFGFSATPSANFMLGPVKVTTGVALGWCDYFRIHPNVMLSVLLADDRLEIYAGATGKDEYTNFYGLRQMDHYISAAGIGSPIGGNNVVDAYLGFRGRMKRHFQYGIKGGFDVNREMPLYMASQPGTLSYAFAFADYNLAYADVNANWKNERFDIKGDFHFKYVTTTLKEDVFAPEMFRASLEAMYNWNKRVYAGIRVAYASRSIANQGLSSQVCMPWYIDLGLSAEYKINRHVSVWLKGMNLLDQDIRLTPAISRKGPAATLGACFSL